MKGKTMNKLWVFDTQNYLEIYAPTLKEAEKEMSEMEQITGLDFVLSHDWRTYQNDHERDYNK
jgi:hypothetical protein